MQSLGKVIIVIGVITVIVGVIIYFAGNKFTWLGRLPGDVRIERENFKFYFPITTMIIISIVVSLLLKLFRKL